MLGEDRSEDGIWSIECPECGRRHLLRLGCCCLFSLMLCLSGRLTDRRCAVSLLLIYRDEEQEASRKEEGSVGKL